MKKNLCEMIFILDRSGSMRPLTDDTIGGFNSMIDNQKSVDGEAYVTTVLFDDKYEILHDHININEIKEITNEEYYARGCTSLLDAMGRTIDNIGERLSVTPEEERPEKVIIVIVTDGYENSSTDYSREKVKEMVEHQQNKYFWTFMFLGANMDAIGEAGGLGIKGSHARTYTNSKAGLSSVYDALDSSICAQRCADYTVMCSASVDEMIDKTLSSII